MPSFEETITKACRENDIPGAVLVAESKSDKLHYAKSFGVRSVVTQSPLKLDATMWIASCTKLMTTVACMQCIEGGLLSLDADVTTILPELKDVPILTGFDDENGGKPILVKNTKPITLRHLLTHSSGLAYDILNPTLMRYLKYIGTESPKIGEPDDRRIKEKYVFPLLFAPGEGWEYSVGLDWAGQMIERVNNITLEEYFQKNIWNPLGIQDFTFRPQNNKAVKDRLAEIAWRHGGVNDFGSTDNPKGKMEATDNKFWDPTTPDCYGGAGLYGSMPQYNKLLQDIISDTPKVLKLSSIDEMFTPQLTKSSAVGINTIRTIEEINNGFGALDREVEANWGLGGIMNMADLKTGRKKGSIAWGGYPNLMWWADRTSGVAGIYGSQICPPGDPLTLELNGLWEKEIYDELNGTKVKL